VPWTRPTLTRLPIRNCLSRHTDLPGNVVQRHASSEAKGPTQGGRRQIPLGFNSAPEISFLHNVAILAKRW
jgi:hypothetical protein